MFGLGLLLTLFVLSHSDASTVEDTADMHMLSSHMDVTRTYGEEEQVCNSRLLESTLHSED